MMQSKKMNGMDFPTETKNKAIRLHCPISDCGPEFKAEKE